MPDPLIGGDRRVTDRLLFRDRPDGETLHVFGWAGQWPPPQEMLVVVEEATNDFKVTEWRLLPKSHQDWLLEHDGRDIRVSMWELNRASQLEEPAKPHESWFRGAEYLQTSSTLRV